MKRLVVDIEGNDLLSNMVDFSKLPYKLKTDAKLWCIVVRDVDTDEVVRLKSVTGNTILKQEVQNAFQGCTEIIAHNGIKFDFIALSLFGVFDYEVGYLNTHDKIFGQDVKITDTLVRSRLFHPDRFGGHSLDSWGKRVGNYKDDFRQQSIDAGLIPKGAPKGAEFKQYSELMLDYCTQDTLVTKLVHLQLEEEFLAYPNWAQAEKLENKLADLAIRRESYGFWFDKDFAVQCLEDLQQKMQDLSDKVNPILPPKPMNKGTLKAYTPPKTQLKKDGSFSTHMVVFANKHGAELDDVYKTFTYEGYTWKVPFEQPIKTHEVATIDDLDHVKMHLISLGWTPSEFKVRDLTKNSKKQSVPYEVRIKALNTWLDQTFVEGKYTKDRLRELDMGTNREIIYAKLASKLKDDKPVRIPTSPSVRVGVEKELCPNLAALGSKVGFANDFSLYLTYRHRKSSIAGGDIEDMDFDDETPNTGFLAMYRDVDGRVPTPAIEVGASTNRYRHIGVCNIARASSVYGKEMRSMFGCGSGMVQLGFDFSSLEARIQGHYILPFGGEELAEQLLASKPNDVHSINAKKLGIARDQAKSVSYALMYGASWAKLKTMLGLNDQEAKALFDAYWDAVAPLKNLRDAVENAWTKRGKQFVIGVDGRKIMTRSKYSLLNALFQSGGVICAKYATVFIYQLLEAQGYKCDPFKYADIDMCGMIEYHDECQLAVKPSLCNYKVFKTEDEAETFVKEWEGEQLGSIVEGKGGTYVVALPNDVSKAISKAIDMAVETVGLKVPLGMEWVVHKNWYGCH